MKLKARIKNIKKSGERSKKNDQEKEMNESMHGSKVVQRLDGKKEERNNGKKLGEKKNRVKRTERKEQKTKRKDIIKNWGGEGD